MRRITLSALTFDALGFVEIEPLPATRAASFSRRVNRVQTLDGGIAVNDFGFSDADRTMTVVWETLDEASEANVRRLLRDHGRLHVTTDDGMFLAAPESYAADGGESTAVLLVLKKVSA